MNDMSSNSSRERDLVLAPNEYAYISDQTKGHIIAYVGPYKTSMANTDKPVYFDKEQKRFVICSLEESTQTFTTAPEGWYIVLKNPAQDGLPPKNGTSNNLPALNIGRKVNIPGPVFFSLWPGQMAYVVQGHHLRTNQYLLVRVYEEEEARKNWAKAVIKPQTTDDAKEITDFSDQIKAEDLTMGQLIVIKGTKVSFYIPPTGIEVVRDHQGNFVRDAVTLERLEYCILLDENGNKRFIQGPDVVFPNPTETFVTRNGQRKFRAIELSEMSGIYVKVIAPYTENEQSYKVGDELFITGKDQMIYFPRPEHALIKYGDQEIYHAVAIPPGEGRYYLNRKTGKISLMKGPCMFLPDPREFVMVRRILSKKQVELMFPGNAEALAYNMELQKLVEQEQRKDDYLMDNQLDQYKERAKASAKKQKSEHEQMQQMQELEIVSEEFARKTNFSKPRTITLNSKYEGAVNIDVWTGYAILVLSKTGERKVIVGPKNYLLEYDETLGVIELSTGKPKSDDNRLRTVYLRTLNNQVSDVVVAETKDLTEVKIELKYRVNFTGQEDKWFDVENYVKFLTDHMRSVLRNGIQKLSIVDFYANGISIVRDLALGQVSQEQETRRPGKLFQENGLQLYDVEVMNISIMDSVAEDMIFDTQQNQVRQQLDLVSLQNQLNFTKEQEDIQRQISLTKYETLKQQLELKKLEAQMRTELDSYQLENEQKVQEIKLETVKMAKNSALELAQIDLQKLIAEKSVELEFAEKTMEQRLKELDADVEGVVKKAQAISPDLIAALQMFSDRALAEKMAETMAPLAILGGKSVADVFANLLKGTALENTLKQKGFLGIAPKKQD